eukprot:540643-Prymnesium_polylepis.1
MQTSHGRSPHARRRASGKGRGPRARRGGSRAALNTAPMLEQLVRSLASLHKPPAVAFVTVHRWYATRDREQSTPANRARLQQSTCARPHTLWLPADRGHVGSTPLLAGARQCSGLCPSSAYATSGLR